MNEFYIWGAYGVTAAVLILEMILLLRRARKSKDLK
jgi:heme exporter protein CcmD